MKDPMGVNNMAASIYNRLKFGVLQFRIGATNPNWGQLIRTLVSENSKPNSHNNSTFVSSNKFQSTQKHFGFQSVSEEERDRKVYDMFENLASRYDLMNDVMTGGIHRLWKDIFLEHLAPSQGTRLLDVAGGTGDIALRFLKYVKTPTHVSTQQDFDIPKETPAKIYMGSADGSPSSSSSSSSSDEENSETSRDQLPPDPNGSHVTVCDINQAMLDIGKQKSKQMGYTSGISWIKGNAEALQLPENQFDAYTIGFGIRNCTHMDKVLSEAYRVLKPGGRFMCLEYSEVKNPVFRSIYDTYSFQVIPVLGQVIAGDWKSYQYLVESIRRFPNQEDFSVIIKAAGFRMVSYENLTFGVAAIHSGFKI